MGPRFALSKLRRRRRATAPTPIRTRAFCGGENASQPPWFLLAGILLTNAQPALEVPVFGRIGGRDAEAGAFWPLVAVGAAASRRAPQLSFSFGRNSPVDWRELLTRERFTPCTPLAVGAPAKEAATCGSAVGSATLERLLDRRRFTLGVRRSFAVAVVLRALFCKQAP